METYQLHTQKEKFYNITAMVKDAVKKSGIQDGFCVVHCPHTTAGLMINENADPDVMDDLLFALNQISPDRPEFKHIEGNSAAHLKAALLGSSVTVLIEEGRLVLGIWQGIYFGEFDGPRTRHFYVKCIGK